MDTGASEASAKIGVREIGNCVPYMRPGWAGAIVGTVPTIVFYAVAEEKPGWD
jgi:hypothetical protein